MEWPQAMMRPQNGAPLAASERLAKVFLALTAIACASGADELAMDAFRVTLALALLAVVGPAVWAHYLPQEYRMLNSMPCGESQHTEPGGPTLAA